ncbi:MAG: carbon-nitrogen family hydrolase [Deltaproteobacteria bacterium]|jgi:predicted amidohydrolase|nr:carbon-nitrogen family hydrolase [Deltaproteobacteria bacterium]
MLTVGLAQIDVHIADRAYNQNTVRAWMARYCKVGSAGSVVVLPEIWDIGYALTETETLADDNGNTAATFLGSLAKEYGVWFAGGSILAGTKEGAFNRAQIINPAGVLTASYDKAHLVPMMDEPLYLKSGSRRCTFDLAGTKAGCVICYDLRFCEFIRRYALDGIKVLFISAQWPEARISHWITLLKARAIENMMYVVACNRVGTSGGTLFGGNSMVIDPWGEILYQASGDREEGNFITFDPEKVQGIRDSLKVFEMRRPDLY